MRPRYPIPREDLSPPPLPNICSIESTLEIPVNAATQKKAVSEIDIAEKSLPNLKRSIIL